MKAPVSLCRYFVLVAFAALLPVQQAFGIDNIQSKSVLLMEMGSGRILYQIKANERIAPASLTKILGVYTALKIMQTKKMSTEATVTVSKAAASPGGSCMGLRPGEKVSIDKLLYGISVASGNDASQALAEHLAGSHQAFVKEMNRYAKALGMEQSAFKNAHGMPAEGQRTTARDMAVLTRAYLQAFPEMLHYHSARSLRHNGKITTNKNPLVSAVNGVDGLKSGWITASGYNLVTTAQRGGYRLILVVLGAPTPEVRAQDTLRLLESGFAALSTVTTVKSQLALRKPSDFTVSLAQARQAALSDLSRTGKVTGNIGSPKPAPVAVQGAARTTPVPAPSSNPASRNRQLAVGSIGSPSSL